jgi:glycerophosphoryl diester phosphodiesterase
MNEFSQWTHHAPLVIAHRGASAYAPENTLAAFIRAVELNADAVELDAKLLKDGSIIILHDTTLDRTSNGTGSIYRYSFHEIRNLDAGSQFSKEFVGERIPTLEAVFEKIGGDILINVELTNYTRPRDQLPLKVIRLIQRYKLQKKVLLSSFNPLALMVAKRVDPEIPRALLVHAGEPEIIRMILRKVVDHIAFHPDQSLITKKLMAEARKNRKIVNAWTVNDRTRMAELLTFGVDGLITDFPDVARNVLNEMKKKEAM